MLVKPDPDLTPEMRTTLLDTLVSRLERYYEGTGELPVTPDLDLQKISEAVRCHDLSAPVGEMEALEAVLSGMEKYTVHTPHPMYYGLFNPRAGFAGIVADLVTAVFNPQLAAWSHSPYASEVEKYMVEFFGSLFGYGTDNTDGAFASGGAEANFTAILCALNHAFPETGTGGVAAIGKPPVIYCSAETHHSIQKGARMAGLGSGAVRLVEVDRQLRMKPGHLERMVAKDQKAGFAPFMVVATAGTTGTGSIDPLEETGRICRDHGLWYHVDAAYGGAVILDRDMKRWLGGIELSDSLIVDLHKWFSVPMAASLFLTRDPQVMYRTFDIRTGYMPGDARDLPVTDPFAHTFQWSRRFIGLKIYMSLLMYGTEGYARVIKKQVETGNRLRELLRENGWKILNNTPLPVVCFTDESSDGDPGFTRAVCDRVVRSGQAWISVYPVHGVQALRACITNYNTDQQHLCELVELLGKARKQINGQKIES